MALEKSSIKANENLPPKVGLKRSGSSFKSSQGDETIRGRIPIDLVLDPGCTINKITVTDTRKVYFDLDLMSQSFEFVDKD